MEDRFVLGCGCSDQCFRQFSIEEIFLIRMQMKELDKSEREMLLLGKLQLLGRYGDSVAHATKTTRGKRHRVTYKYAYDHRSLCRDAFFFVHTVGEKALNNLQRASKGEWYHAA